MLRFTCSSASMRSVLHLLDAYILLNIIPYPPRKEESRASDLQLRISEVCAPHVVIAPHPRQSRLPPRGNWRPIAVRVPKQHLHAGAEGILVQPQRSCNKPARWENESAGPITQSRSIPPQPGTICQQVSTMQGSSTRDSCCIKQPD